LIELPIGNAYRHYQLEKEKGKSSQKFCKIFVDNALQPYEKLAVL
jgi:hypothetical protein